MSGNTPLAVGTCLRIAGIDFAISRITATNGGLLTLIAADGTESPVTITITDLLRGGFEFLDATGRPERDTARRIFMRLPEKIRREALVRLEHLRDVFPELFPIRLDEGTTLRVTRPEYDPASTTVGRRIAAKIRETGLARRTLYDLRTRYLASQELGLVDARSFRPLLATTFTGIELEAIEAVYNAGINRSRAFVRHLYEAWCAELLRRKVEPEEIPSLSTFQRKFRPFAVARSYHGSMRYSRSVANRPDPPYASLQPVRCGQIVVLDSSPYDLFALDDATGEPVRLQWTIAYDVKSGAVLAFRVTPKDAKGVDAALLLAQLLVPKSMQPGYSDAARWAYLGVPEAMVLAATLTPEGPGLAASPLVVPETLAVDRGKIFLSQTFQDAAAALNMDIIVLRPGSPTDKPETERFFRSAKTFFAKLPGYTGGDINSRGWKVEEDALLFTSELAERIEEWLVEAWNNHAIRGRGIPGFPKIAATPNRLFEEDLQRWGFLYVPPSVDLYYDLLETHWCVINHYGIDCQGRYYDDPALNSFRDKPSPYNEGNRALNRRASKKTHRWKIKVDPRDLSEVYFHDPQGGAWHTIPWRDALGLDRPFNDRTAAYAHLLARRNGAAALDRNAYAAKINELIDRRFDGTALSVRRELREFLKQRTHDQQRHADRTRARTTRRGDPGDRDLAADLLSQISEVSSDGIEALGLFTGDPLDTDPAS